MQSEIIINAEPGETRVAILERSQFTELHIEREQGKSVVGNVVKGKVSRVLPGMQAAFVDIGLEKAAFLYVGDYFDNTPGGDGDVDPPARDVTCHTPTSMFRGKSRSVPVEGEPVAVAARVPQRRDGSRRDQEERLARAVPYA